MRSSETSFNFYQVTGRHVREASGLHSHRCESSDLLYASILGSMLDVTMRWLGHVAEWGRIRTRLESKNLKETRHLGVRKSKVSPCA
jgi:hypothetical protein